MDSNICSLLSFFFVHMYFLGSFASLLILHSSRMYFQCLQHLSSKHPSIIIAYFASFSILDFWNHACFLTYSFSLILLSLFGSFYLSLNDFELFIAGITFSLQSFLTTGLYFLQLCEPGCFEIPCVFNWLRQGSDIIISTLVTVSFYFLVRKLSSMICRNSRGVTTASRRFWDISSWVNFLMTVLHPW